MEEEEGGLGREEGEWMEEGEGEVIWGVAGQLLLVECCVTECDSLFLPRTAGICSYVITRPCRTPVT
jgi:hypothetical protein